MWVAEGRDRDVSTLVYADLVQGCRRRASLHCGWQSRVGQWAGWCCQSGGLGAHEHQMVRRKKECTVSGFVPATPPPCAPPRPCPCPPLGQVRNLVEHAGLDVRTLRRVRIGGYRLPRGLAFGQYVELAPNEVRRVLDRGADQLV